jgi:hypothetical protein
MYYPSSLIKGPHLFGKGICFCCLTNGHPTKIGLKETYKPISWYRLIWSWFSAMTRAASTASGPASLPATIEGSSPRGVHSWTNRFISIRAFHEKTVPDSTQPSLCHCTAFCTTVKLVVYATTPSKQQAPRSAQLDLISWECCGCTPHKQLVCCIWKRIFWWVFLSQNLLEHKNNGKNRGAFRSWVATYLIAGGSYLDGWLCTQFTTAPTQLPHEALLLIWIWQNFQKYLYERKICYWTK